MNNAGKNIVALLMFLFLALMLVNIFAPQNVTKRGEITYSEFLKKVDAGQISDVDIQGRIITGSSGESRFTSFMPADDKLVDRLISKGVNIKAKPEDSSGGVFMSLLMGWGPVLLLIGVWIYFMRNAGGGGKAMGFGKSRAKLLTQQNGRITFDDVAGVEEAKEEVQEIVEFLRDPMKFQRLGGRIPKGVLLVGPPGTGKTLLARAIAGEANVPFFSISGSDFVEMFVGVGASRVRDMFETAKKHAPCLVFIDEIDAVGRHRGAGLGGGNDEREQTLNQLLVEMDGFEGNEGVILIAATNRPDVLDPALLRPGRFDRQVVVGNPDVAGREKILKVHMRKVPLAADVDPKSIARATPGFSGADLQNLVNEAALMAARKNKKTVAMEDFEQARDKVIMGPERRSMVMDEKEKEMTAYHEAGHAIVQVKVEGNMPIHKATIIPRGRALGAVFSLPEKDVRTQSVKQYKAMIAMAFGGRIAEEIIYGHENVTNGAVSDIKQATNMARAMVMQFGMSDKLGRVRYESNQEEVFLGHSVAQSRNISEDTARIIDQEVRRLIEEGENLARQVITDNRQQFEAIAKALLEYETISGDEIKQIVNGEKINRPDPPPAPPAAPEADPVVHLPGSRRRSSVPSSDSPAASATEADSSQQNSP